MKFYFQKIIKVSIRKVLLSVNSRGMIVESLIGFMVLALGTLGMVKYMQPVQKISQGLVETKQMSNLRGATLLVLKNLLVNVKESPDGEHVKGLCFFINSSAGSRGVENLTLSFENLNSNDLNNSFKPSSWEEVFPESEWEFVSDTSHCGEMADTLDKRSFEDTPFSKCIKYISPETVTSEMYVWARIIPVEFQLDGGSITPKKLFLSQKNVSLDSMGFKIRMDISGFHTAAVSAAEESEEASQTIYTLEDMVFPSDATYCDIAQKDHIEKNVQAWFSGVGPVVLEPVIYNQAVSQEDITVDVCNIEIHENMNRSYLPGIINSSVNDKSFLKGKDKTGLSCTTKTFLCPGDSALASHFGDLEFTFGVNNNTVESIPIKKLQFTLGRKSGNKINELDGIVRPKELSGSGVEVSFYYSSDLGLEIKGNTDLDPVFHLPPGNGYFRVVVKGAGSRCVSICEKYTADPPVYPLVSMDVSDKKGKSKCIVQSEWQTSDVNRVECQYCQMNACHNATEKAYGNHLRAGEPLDAYLPECGFKPQPPPQPTYNRNLPKIKPYELSGGPSRDYTADFENNCWALSMPVSKIAGSNTPFNRVNSYQPLECSEERPVLCYANGGYRVAMNFVGKERKIVKASFYEAQKICHEMGREIVSRENLEKMLEHHYPSSPAIQNYINSFPGVDDQFDFINLAGSGIFIAPYPEYGKVRSNFVKTLESITGTKLNINNLNTLFEQYIDGSDIKDFAELWLAMEYDAGGYIVGSPPWVMIPDGVSSSQPPSDRLMYFNKDADKNAFKKAPAVTLVKDTTPPPGGGGRYASVSHNVRWRGIQLESDETKKFYFVCQRDALGFPPNNSKFTYNFYKKEIEYYLKKYGYLSFSHWIDGFAGMHLPSAEGYPPPPPVPRTYRLNYVPHPDIPPKPEFILPPVLLLENFSTGSSLEEDKAFIVTTAKGPFSKGPEKCKDAGGRFVPPVSGVDWARVMWALEEKQKKQKSDDQAFPDLNLGTLAQTEVEYQYSTLPFKAWVALEHKVDSPPPSQVFKTQDLRFARTLWNSNQSIFYLSSRQAMLDKIEDEGFYIWNDSSNCNDTRCPKRLSYALMRTNGDLISAKARNLHQPDWYRYPHWNPWGTWKWVYYKKEGEFYTNTNYLLPAIGGTAFSSLSLRFINGLARTYIPVSEAVGITGSLIKGFVKGGAYSSLAGASTLQINRALSGFSRVCVQEINPGDGQFVPRHIVSSNSTTCPSGSRLLDICKNPYDFQPSSYIYMSYWYKNIYLDNESKELVLAQPKFDWDHRGNDKFEGDPEFPELVEQLKKFSEEDRKNFFAHKDAPTWCEFDPPKLPPPDCPPGKPTHYCGPRYICDYEPDMSVLAAFRWERELNPIVNNWMGVCDNKQCPPEVCPTDCNSNWTPSKCCTTHPRSECDNCQNKPEYPKCCAELNNPSPQCDDCDNNWEASKCCATHPRPECDDCGDTDCFLGCLNRGMWREKGRTGGRHNKDWFYRSDLFECMDRCHFCKKCSECIKTCPAGKDRGRIQSQESWYRSNRRNRFGGSLCDDGYRDGDNIRCTFACSESDRQRGRTKCPVLCGGLECLRYKCSPLCNNAFDNIPEHPAPYFMRGYKDLYKENENSNCVYP